MNDLSEELYKNCRWCKWYRETGTCKNDVFGISDNGDFFVRFFEDGHLAEAIKEGFNEYKFNEFEQALVESNLSRKRVTEIMKIFRQELDVAQLNWTEKD